MITHNPITIVRIEHPVTKVGLWKSDIFLWSTTSREVYTRLNIIANNAMKNFPTPHTDTHKRIYPKEYCAFRSLRQLKARINKDDLIFIQSLGFEIQLLTVSHYRISRRQVLFEKKHILSKSIIKIRQ